MSERKEHKIDFFKHELEEWLNTNPDGDIGYAFTRLDGNAFSLRVVYPEEETPKQKNIPPPAPKRKPVPVARDLEDEEDEDFEED